MELKATLEKVCTAHDWLLDDYIAHDSEGNELSLSMKLKDINSLVITLSPKGIRFDSY